MAKTEINKAMAIEGMTSPEALALMDIFIGRAVSHTQSSQLVEFGAYKGRTACLMAQHVSAEGFLHIVESADYLELAKIQQHCTRVEWHRDRSEEFTAHKLPRILGDSKITATHHDASHFFNNVHTELSNIRSLVHDAAALILDDFNDVYAQVRAAYYHLRYTAGFPFEILLIGFNKCILVHQDHFAREEGFVLNELLDRLESSFDFPCRLARTDNHPLSRGFCVTKRATGSQEKRYGLAFFGDRFYKPSK